MTKEEMEAQLVLEVKGLSTSLVSIDYTNACSDAERETGWSFPISDNTQLLWMKKRAVRALFFYLFTQSSYKFKYKQASLNQRFDQLERALKMLDEEWEKFQEDYPDICANVSTYKLFGTKSDAGFAYDITGRDVTYDEDQEVIFGPNDTD